MKFEAVIALATLLLAIASFYFPYRNSARKDREARVRQIEADREAESERAIQPYKDQIANLRADLETMRTDRDYFRDLVMKHGVLFQHPPKEDNVISDG